MICNKNKGNIHLHINSDAPLNISKPYGYKVVFKNTRTRFYFVISFRKNGDVTMKFHDPGSTWLNTVTNEG